MATTGIINATKIKLYVASTLVANCTSAELSIQVDMRDATTKDSAGWEEILPGKKSWSMSGDAFHENIIANYEFGDFTAAITSGTLVTVTFSTNVNGDYYWTGSAYVESASISAGVEENTTYSVTLKGSGALTRAVYVAE